MTVSTFLLQTVTPAVLPAADAAGYEYYDVLGLESRQAKESAIRKAYKQKSLQLHPDKQQQQQKQNTVDKDDDDTDDSIAVLYQRVQEAHAVLVDPTQRRLYHDLNCSVARYNFVYVQHGLSNPVALHENLSSASVVDKTRLLVVSAVCIVLVLLQPILIAAKVNGITIGENGLTDAAWVAILIPLWIGMGLYIAALLIGLSVVAYQQKGGNQSEENDDEESNNSNKKQNNTELLISLSLSLCEAACWLAGCVLLAQQWDATEKQNWNITSIPFYGACLLRIFVHLLAIQHIRYTQDCMVSPDYYESHKNEYDEDDDDETQHVVVTPNSAAVVAVLLMLRNSDQQHEELSDEDVEAIRVQTSPEFRAAEKAALGNYQKIGKIVVLYITMIALIAAKLNSAITANWWVVFVPLWVGLGLPLVQHAVVCLFVGPSMDSDDDDDDDVDEEQVILEMDLPQKTSNDNNGGNEDDVAKPSVEFAATEGDMDEFVSSRHDKTDHNNEDIMAEPELLARQDDDDENAAALFHTMEDAPDDEPPIVSKTATTPSDIAAAAAAPTVETKNEEDAPDDEPPIVAKTATTPSDNAAAPTVETKNDDVVEADVETGDNSAPQALKEPQATLPAEEKRDTTTNGTSTGKNENKENDNDDKDDDDDDEEETFRKWQERMYHDDDHGESDFVETKFKALTGCCGYCFQIIILCLIVGKLEQDYDNNNNTDGDAGYSAFWVLFPVFLVAGLLLCCCSICIYGTNKDNDDDDVVPSQQTNTKPPPAEEVSSTAPVVVPAAAAPDATEEASSHSASPASAVDDEIAVAAATADEEQRKQEVVDDVETGGGGGMDDLD